MKVKSLADKDVISGMKGKSFNIFPGMKDRNPNDLEFKQYAKALSWQLEKKGMKRQRVKPDFVVLTRLWNFRSDN